MALVEGLLNQTVPQFCNDLGVREIRIGAKAFECIGETPPQDHPHIYLELSEQSQMLCPYCGTLFSFDSSLEEWEAVPSETLFRNNVFAHGSSRSRSTELPNFSTAMGHLTSVNRRLA